MNIKGGLYCSIKMIGSLGSKPRNVEGLKLVSPTSKGGVVANYYKAILGITSNKVVFN